jgi:hypothetical protein
MGGARASLPDHRLPRFFLMLRRPNLFLKKTIMNLTLLHNL